MPSSSHSSDSSSHRLRPLLPTPHQRPPRDTLPVSNPSATQTPKTGRRVVKSACNPCRQRRIKCNAERPKCSPCISRDIDCHYETASTETHSQALKRKYESLEEKNANYKELYHVLSSRSQREATDILNRLRSGGDVESLVRYIKSGDILLQLFAEPETRYRYHLGDCLRILSFLKTPNNPYLNSLVYKSNFGPTFSITQYGSDPMASTTERLRMYDTPFHTVQLVDPKLNAVEPSKWTAVISDDVLLRKLLEIYFIYEYPSFPFFHKDYFLDDMAIGRTRFCSSLLVNSVLASACCGHRGISNRAEFWDPQNLSYRFLAEAKRLWELDAEINRITTVQAAAIMHFTYNKNALDKVGWSYLVQALAMAQEMDLFSTWHKERSNKWRIVQTMTVWGLFTWQGAHCFHWAKPPLVAMHPELPLLDDVAEYGEIWIKYPLAGNPLPLHYGQIFKATAEFRTILADAAYRYFDPSRSEDKISLQQVAEYRSRLQQWYENLPDLLTSQNLVLPIHFQLHMHFHNILVFLFEPLLALETNEADTSLSQSVLLGESPQQIVSHSKKCLHTLIRLYYRCHGGDTLDSFLVHIAMFIGFGALNDISESNLDAETIENLHSTIILCANILCNQSSNFYMAEVVFRLIMHNMPPQDVRALRDFAKLDDNDEKREKMVANHVQSEWPINIVRIPAKSDDRKLENLIQALKEFSVDEADTVGASSPGCSPKPSGSE